MKEEKDIFIVDNCFQTQRMNISDTKNSPFKLKPWNIFVVKLCY